MVINFKGGTERIGVLRKPLNPTDQTITPDNLTAIFHIQHNFIYPLIKVCRPDGFESKLPQAITDYLEKKFEGKVYKAYKTAMKKKNHK